MLLRLFKGTTPGVIFLITITLIAVWLQSFITPLNPQDSVFETSPMPLYGLLQKIIGNRPVFGVIFSFSLIVIVSFLLVNLNTKILFISERTFLPAIIYVLLSGFFPTLQVLNPVIPASVFLMIAVRRIMDGYRQPGIVYNFFDAGIIIAVGSLFYFNLIWFGLLLLVGIALLRTGSLSEIFLSGLGLITPYFLTFGIYYVIDKDLNDLIITIGSNIIEHSAPFIFHRITIVGLLTTGLLILVSIIYLFMRINTKKIKSRKTFYLLLWFLMISLGVYFIVPSLSIEIAWLAAIPVSFFLAHYFVLLKKRVLPEILFSILFIIVIVIQILV